MHMEGLDCSSHKLSEWKKKLFFNFLFSFFFQLNNFVLINYQTLSLQSSSSKSRTWHSFPPSGWVQSAHVLPFVLAYFHPNLTCHHKNGVTEQLQLLATWI